MQIRMEGAVGARTIFSGKTYDYFSGTGYLGLQSHPQVIAAAKKTIELFGLSSATSRGGYGENPVYDELDSEINLFFGSQRNLYFASGFLGNLILAQGLTGRYDRVFVDESSHFSVWDGLHAAGKPIHKFKHLDPEDLKGQIKIHMLAGEKPLVFSDGVFPISGEIAPINRYLELVEQYDGRVCLDDAHAAGVLGEHGRGTLEHFRIYSSRCVSTLTLSKALGGYGGVIAGTEELIDELDRNSKVYVAASPPPLPSAGASAAALRIARITPELLLKLRANVKLAREGFRGLGWQLEENDVPILCLRKREGVDLGYLKERLFERQIAVAHVTTYSSTPEGGAIRIAISASHSMEQIDNLIHAIKEVINQ